MKTIIILAVLFPLLASALRRLILYIVRFDEQKCGGCPSSTRCAQGRIRQDGEGYGIPSCGPRQKNCSCREDKKNFTAHL